MNTKQKGNVAFAVIVSIILCLPWMVNAYKLFNCDFRPDYKCEVIHTLGFVIPPASYITMFVEGE